ncbi:Bodo-specific multi-copy gene family, putative [Bodo saltans]|uniref:Bodo-specific multi-copy gene family, putative n=1 Tax=Bodo saltans TaxID=75058 RepID=A0A0S4IHE4_BODSA|nr:Bodo-specific multi-copy gene family, putative [Bodo saltans]|eukprot:CUE63872.1 Bodo-specific multi-copy gene family, putative [Bodo saltans]
MRRLAPLLRRSFGLSATSMCRSGLLASDNTSAKYYDSTTWPKHWTATDIEALLRDNLAKSGGSPDYDRLADLHRLGDSKSLNLLLDEYVVPQEVNLEEYFAKHLHKVVDSAVIPVQSHVRENMFDRMDVPLQSHENMFDSMEQALSPKMGSERTIVICSAPRNSGKTTLLKRFVVAKLSDAMKCGRVIVRCCDVAASIGTNEWIAQVLEARATASGVGLREPIGSHVESGLCELIRTHVEAVTGLPQEPSAYCDPQTAYTTWMSETARHFKIPLGKENVDPLIILDSCEILSRHSHKSMVHKSSGEPYTLLETFCLKVPSPHGILVFGSHARFDPSDPILLFSANVVNIELFRDPDTWPRHWTADDIKTHLEDSILSSVPEPNYEALSAMLRIGDTQSIKMLIDYIFKHSTVQQQKAPELTFEQCIGQYINKGVDLPDMKLQGRMEQLNKLDEVLTIQPHLKHEKQVAFCYSPRGSGKTQLIMYFVSEKRANAMKCGRVIVRCCEKAAHAQWFQAVKNSKEADGLCELVRIHVQSVTKTSQDPKKYSDPNAAYETWISETARYFGISSSEQQIDPLIILDSCESFAKSDHKLSPTGKQCTLLEAFCHAVPSPYCIFVIGCSADIVSDSVTSISGAMKVEKLNPLAPLSELQFASAISESWFGGSVKKDIFLPLYHWTGGLPRLLRLAHTSSARNVRLTEGDINVLSEQFEAYKVNVENDYPIQSEWFPSAYTCFLASSTKARVTGSDIINVNPDWKQQTNHALTYDKAAAQSIGAYDPNTRLFMVPPITFVDAVVKKHKNAVPILPSQLHPFLNSEVVKHFGKDNALERGIQFEEPFMYAVHARYLLASWANSNKPWVSLEKIFEGAVRHSQEMVLSKYEANLSAGVMLGNCRKKYPALENAVTYLGGTAKHDAYLWCREKKANDKLANGRKKKETLVAVPLQLRHGKPKPPVALMKQLKGSKILLSVNQEDCNPMKKHINRIVMVNASAMSSISWLWLISSQTPKKRKRKHKRGGISSSTNFPPVNA